MIMEDFYQYNRAYYIKFKSLESESDTYFTNYLFPNFGRILEESGKDAIVIEEDENGQDTMIVFLEDIKLSEFVSFCKEEDIIDQHEDITYRLLTHDNLEEVILKMLRSDEFGKQFQQFFEKNVTMDSILDKISKNGEDSLTEYENNFLKDEVARNRTYNLHK